MTGAGSRGLALVSAALIVAAIAGAAYGESTDPDETGESAPAAMANSSAETSDDDNPAAANAKAKMSPTPMAKAAPQMRFDAGELAVLRRLADRRRALEAREARIVERERLARALEHKLAQQAKELRRLRAALAEQEARAEIAQKTGADEKTERLKRLAKAYKAMKPKDAARLFNDLDMELLTGIAGQISPRVLAPVLAKMHPERARELTRALQENGA